MGVQRKTVLSRATRPPASDADDPEGADVYQPLSAEEAARWRALQPHTCMGCVLTAQIVVAGVMAVLLALVSGRMAWGWSAAYGVLAVVVPNVFYLRRARRRVRQLGSALINLLFSQLVKVVLTALLLLLAPRVVPGLSWPAMLVGTVAALQAYWLGLMWMSVRATRAARRLAERAASEGSADRAGEQGA